MLIPNLGVISIYASDLLESNDKYNRTNSFSELYSDVFFRTSPGVLQLSNMFIDEQLLFRRDAAADIVPIHRSFASRNVGFYFENVPIHNIYTGKLDLSQLNLLSHFFYLDNQTQPHVADIGINRTFAADTNLRRSIANVSIAAGNPIGSVGGHYFSRYKYLSFFLSSAFVSSIGTPLSSDSPDELTSPSSYLRKSSNDQASLFGKVFFNNGASQIGISIYSSLANKFLPPNYRQINKSYLSLRDVKNNFINFEFHTKLETFFDVGGNLFFRNHVSDVNSFDDSTYSSTNSAKAFRANFDGYSYGGNLYGEADWGFSSPFVMSLQYFRDIMNNQKDKELQTNRYETESLNIILSQKFDLASIYLIPSLAYTVKKPLFSDISPIKDNLSAIDFKFEASTDLSSSTKLSLFALQKSNMPTLEQFFHQKASSDSAYRFLSPEQDRNLSLEFSTSNSDFSSRLSLFVSDVSNFIFPLSDINGDISYINKGSTNCYGLDASIKLLADYGYILLNYTYSNFTKEPAFLTKPKHLAEIKIYNTYSFGLRWLIEGEFFSNSYKTSDNVNDLAAESLFLLNIRVGLKIFERNEMFVSLHNLLDSYYESTAGIPAPGFSFLFGLNFNF